MTERYTLGHVPEVMRVATARFEEDLGTPDGLDAVQQTAHEVSSES